MNWEQAGRLADALTKEFVHEEDRWPPRIALEHNVNGAEIAMYPTIGANFLVDRELQKLLSFAATYEAKADHRLALGISTTLDTDKVHVVFFEPCPARDTAARESFEDIPF